MANRYWVGGAGTWNTTNTANWSATSGGAGGASVPTASDDVFFDANSGTGNVANANNVNCGSIDCTGFTGSIGAGANSIQVYGNFKLGSGMAYYFAPTYLSQTTGTWNVDFAGIALSVTFAFGPFGGASGGATYVLQSDYSNGNGVLNYGTVINTNGFTVTTTNLSNLSGTNNNWIFGSSTVNLSGATPLSINATANYGTSTINCSSAGATTFNGGATFYNVNFTGGSTTTITVSGASTFNNLSITATTAGTKTISFGATNTISGSLTTSGTTSANRIQFGSSVAGTQRTLSVATIGTLTNTNWKDIALTGAASPWTAPLGVYDLGNNSGITFDTTTLYWIGGAGTWSDGAEWSTSSGGAAANVAPGPQNSVIFNASSGTGTVTCASGYCNDFTASSSSAVTFSGALNVYGSFTGGGSATYTSFNPTFAATTTGKTINTGGKTLGTPTFNGVGGGWTLQDALNCSSNPLTVTNGSFITGNFNVTCGSLVSTGTGTRSITLGSSTITASGSTPVNLATTGSLTFNAGTSQITSASTTTSFVGAGQTFYNVTINSAAFNIVIIAITGANTFNNLRLNAAATGVSGFSFSANQTINGTFTCAGSNGNSRVLVATDTAGTQRTVTAATTSLTDVDFYGIIGAGAAAWTGTRVGNGSLNSGITFTPPKTVYWSLAAGGSWMSSTAWATTSGGTPATTNFPLPQDTALIVDTGLNSGATINVGTDGNVSLCNIDFSARTLAMTFGFNGFSSRVCGNITWDANVTCSGANGTTFYGSTTLTSAGVTLTPPITIATGATLTNSGALTTSNTLTCNGTLTLGANATFTTLTLNGTTNLSTYTLYGATCTLGAASTTNFGTSKISLTGNNTTIFTGDPAQTITGTPVVECTYSGATGTRTLSPSTPTEANTISFNFTAGTDTVSFTASQYVKSLDFTGFAGTWGNVATTIYGNLTVSTGMTLATGTGTRTFAGTSGPYTITTNGKTLDFPITFNGAGGTWQLADNLLQGSTRISTLTNGTLDLNGKSYTVGSFATAAGTKNLTFNGGTLTAPAVTTTAFNNAQPTGFTTTAGTGTGKISMTGATAKTFVGGGSTYNCTLEQAGAGALTITGSNTFNNIANTTQPVSVLFTAGTTNTFNNFSLSGTSGNLVTIGSVTAASHTLSKSSGIVSVSYCTISRSTATGGASWQAYTTNGNVNGGNNSGWLFSEFSANGLLFGSNF